MNQSKRRHGTGKKSKAAFHPFLRCKRQLTLPEHVFKGMYRKFLMTLENHKIMSVTLVITEKEVLAMDGIYLLPIFKSQLYRRKRRMCMKFICQSVLFEKGEDFVYSWISCHLFRLFA